MEAQDLVTAMAETPTMAIATAVSAAWWAVRLVEVLVRVWIVWKRRSEIVRLGSVEFDRADATTGGPPGSSPATHPSRGSGGVIGVRVEPRLVGLDAAGAAVAVDGER